MRVTAAKFKAQDCLSCVSEGILESTRFIYALVDPRKPRAVRYVGCASQIARRLRQHLFEARFPTDTSFYKNPQKFRFLLHLLCDGRLPEMLLLEAVPAGGRHLEREKRWIRRFRSRGADLTNFERPLPPPGRERLDPNLGAVNFFRRGNG